MVGLRVEERITTFVRKCVPRGSMVPKKMFSGLFFPLFSNHPTFPIPDPQNQKCISTKKKKKIKNSNICLIKNNKREGKRECYKGVSFLTYVQVL